ncbi:MAG: UDP-N-acetylmuramoyl-L-alanine--D-glutamate ligase [Flavobacteriales bacterium]|jgi:UDP-N-acetylmuramoylalanine--D-glutamate ligase|nr:UDP-N-acetylmuramoyl-L-alanine--D-glutamate ligase [Flavobacteriales bacterium]
MKRLVVLGAGESGVGAAILGKVKNYDVFVSDSGTITQKYKDVLLHNKIQFEEGKHSEDKIFNAILVVKSPGIPDSVPLIKELRKRGIKIVSEIEFAATYTDAFLVAITGSNGKTTTTLLTYHILKKAGLNVGVAGNIGQSFALQVAEKKHDYYVLEISSFQLDDIYNFKPDVAIITNISEDHLDRYDYKMQNYIDSKLKITQNQTENDYLIYDADDAFLKSEIKKSKAQLIPFTVLNTLEKNANGAQLIDNKITIKVNKETYKMEKSILALTGMHNTKNAMAAAMASTLLRVRKETIRESLEDFEGAEHRLEQVLNIQGVKYINDSKATNVNATFYALECMDNPTIWIVGGVDKGNDYNTLLPMVRENVKAIICLGIDNSKLLETFSNVVDFIMEAAGMEEAVKIAHKLSEKNDTVLLSPACASFDLFENYEDRGRQFKDAVRNL